MKIRLLYSLYIVIILLISDFIVGKVNDIEIYRESMRSFQSQVNELNISTKQFVPNIDDDYKEFYLNDGYGFQSNNNGIPDALDNTDYEKNILFFGGSTTENNEVSLKKRFTNIVKDKFKIIDNNIGVKNLAVRGHSSQDSLNIYLNHQDESIDMANIVVFMHNINDRLYLAIKGGYRTDLPYYRPYSLNEIYIKMRSLIGTIYNFIKFNSNIVFLTDSLIINNIRKDVINEKNIDKKFKFTDQNYNNFKQNLELFIAIAHTKKQIPILMTQPLGYVSESQNDFNEIIRKVAKEKNVGLIDLAKKIKISMGSDYFLDDGIHFNDYGSEKTGHIIYEYLSHYFNHKPTSNCKKNSLLTKYLQSNILEGRYPSLSENKKEVLFQKNSPNKNSISILNIETLQINNILEINRSEYFEHPAWIDKNEILYGVRDANKNSIYKYNLISKKSKKLNLKIYGAIAHVNKSNIFFAGYKSIKEPINIYKLNQTNNKISQITNDHYEKWRPIVSNDTLYFIKKIDGKFKLSMINLLNGREELLMQEEDDIWDPSISQSGKVLAYATRKNGNFLIKIIDMKSNQLITIIESTENNWDPFLIDDSTILYAAEDRNGKSTIKLKCF